MKWVKMAGKFVVILFVLLFITILFFPGKRDRSLQTAKADSLNAYPNVCLGGWQNPGNAAGEPDVQPGGDSFSDQNSAILDQTEAQIFCGYFQSDDQTNEPSSVTLNFSWNFIFSGQTAPVGTDTDSAAWSSVLDATGTATSSIATTTTTVPETATSTNVSSTDTSDTSDTVDTASSSASTIVTTTTPADASDTDSSTQSVAPIPTPPPPPAQTPVTTTTTTPDQSSPDQNQSSTSLLENVFQNPLSFLLKKAFADASDTPADAILDVSYSLDGTTWQDLGEVTADNWQNFSVTVPVTSWSDINKLEIQLNSLPSVDMPTIYLDSMWLTVDYGQSLSGTLENDTNAALDAMGTLSDAVNGAVDSAANALSGLLPSNTTTVTPQSSSDNSAETAAAPAPPPPAHQYVLRVGATMQTDVNDLPWMPPRAAPAPAQSSTLPTVTSADANSVQISGACMDDYYTVLLFANPGDYRDDPSSALVDRSSQCVNGEFSQTIVDTQFPAQLATGTYYLVIAQQGKKGPWYPLPVLYPIMIDNASSSQ